LDHKEKLAVMVKLVQPELRGKRDQLALLDLLENRGKLVLQEQEVPLAQKGQLDPHQVFLKHMNLSDMTDMTDMTDTAL
jgi:hypothetical protein